MPRCEGGRPKVKGGFRGIVDMININYVSAPPVIINEKVPLIKGGFRGIVDMINININKC